MSSTTFARFFVKQVEYPGCGVEVEVEGHGLPTPTISAFWERKEEGSLRAGCEYVSHGCIESKKLEPAMEQLFHALDKKPCKVNEEQPRSSIHVHVNMQPYTMTQVRTICTVIILLDGLMSEYCGRTKNLFCKPLSTSEDTVFSLAELSDWSCSTGNNPFSRLESDLHKYSSVNFSSLFNFGTVEFRAHKYAGKRDAMVWIKALDDLPKRITKMWDTPREFLDWYYKSTKEDLLKVCFGTAMRLRLMQVPQWEQHIADNRQLAVKFVSRSERTLTKKKKSKKKLDLRPGAVLHGRILLDELR
jgi:hypothetical protein